MRRSSRVVIVPVLASFAFACPAPPAPVAPEPVAVDEVPTKPDPPYIRPGEIAEVVRFLADDEQAGRAPGTDFDVAVQSFVAERMGDGEQLTAFVPVSVPVAREIKGWERIPLDELLNALAERGGGRVLLPTGNLWPPVPDAELADEQARLGVTVSADQLPPKISNQDGVPTEIEGAVPLWVQIAIDW